MAAPTKMLCVPRLLLYSGYFVNKVVYRQLYLSCVKCRKGKPTKPLHVKAARIMDKMLTGQRKKWFVRAKPPTDALKPELEYLKPTKKQLSGETHRQKMLNVILFENITDLLAYGETSKYLEGHRLEISQVNVTHDYSHVNVFWLASGSSKDQQLENTLDMVAYNLRHELIQQHVLGSVPPIRFTKDTTVARGDRVQRLLRDADYGDDDDDVAQRPLRDLAAEFREGPVLQRAPASSVAETINLTLRRGAAPPGGEHRKSDAFSVDHAAPPGGGARLKSDVFGVDHAALTRDLVARRNRLKTAEGWSAEAQPLPPLLDRRALERFFAKKTRKEVLRKEMKNYDPGRELLASTTRFEMDSREPEWDDLEEEEEEEDVEDSVFSGGNWDHSRGGVYARGASEEEDDRLDDTDEMTNINTDEGK